jgi:hypothetical protein
MTAKSLLASFIFVFFSTTLLSGRDLAAGRATTSGTAISPVVAQSPWLSESVLAPQPISPSDFPRPAPIAPVGRNLQLLIRLAGIVFSGQVIQVAHEAGSALPNPAATRITFQVEDAIRGTSPHQTLTIREWSGLWTRGERYHVGERVLLFLYPPGKLGFTSPVSGGLGRFAVDRRERVVLNALQITVLHQDPIVRGRSLVPYADFVPAVRRLSLSVDSDPGSEQR